MSYMGDDFGADPEEFFGTAAGPRAVDVIGPRDNILDTYVDGMPVAQAEYISQDGEPAANHGTGGGAPLNLHKLIGPSGIALAALTVGVVLVYHHVK